MRIILTALFCAAALLAADIPRPMQRFLLPDSSGRDHDSNEYRGKVTLLEFMSTKCAHCAAFAGVLKAVEQRYRTRVNIVSLVNPPDLPKDVTAFISAHGVDYPILLDQGRVAYAYIRRQAFDIPYLFVIDSTGQIRNEFEYNPTSVNIFEGDGLFPYIDKLMGASIAAPPPNKK